MPCRWTDLTPREREVAECVGHGLSNHETAQRMGITTHGVKNHKTNMLRKIGIETHSGRLSGNAMFRHVITRWPWCAPGYAPTTLDQSQEANHG